MCRIKTFVDHSTIKSSLLAIVLYYGLFLLFSFGFEGKLCSSIRKQIICLRKIKVDRVYWEVLFGTGPSRPTTGPLVVQLLLWSYTYRSTVPLCSFNTLLYFHWYNFLNHLLLSLKYNCVTEYFMMLKIVLSCSLWCAPIN